MNWDSKRVAIRAVEAAVTMAAGELHCSGIDEELSDLRGAVERVKHALHNLEFAEVRRELDTSHAMQRNASGLVKLGRLLAAAEAAEADEEDDV